MDTERDKKDKECSSDDEERNNKTERMLTSDIEIVKHNWEIF